MRAYHFVSRDYGLDDLRRRRLKLRPIKDLNDPFELLAVSLPYPQMRRAYEQHKEALASWVGMLCFSRTWKNPVQWSHYARRTPSEEGAFTGSAVFGSATVTMLGL